VASIDENGDPLPNAAPNPPPFQFGLKGLFRLVAIVGVLAAGARLSGIDGLLLATWIMCFVGWIWARFTGRRRLGNWLSSLSIYGLLFGMLAALLMPAVNTGRYSRRTHCLSNLRNLGVALIQYEEKNGSFPPMFTIDSNGKPLMSWRTAILPWLERQDVYSLYHADRSWDSPANKQVSQLFFEMFACPSDEGATRISNQTSYVAIIGPHTAWGLGKGVKLADIKDYRSDTLLLVEMKDSGIAWNEPRDLDLNNLPPGLTQQNLLPSLSNHAGGFNAVFADGHEEFIPSTIPWSQFIALTTIDGGESIDRDTW
jgi:prepilin-type processing-associated H-X9-DG protein